MHLAFKCSMIPLIIVCFAGSAFGKSGTAQQVELQPLIAQARRVVEALEFLGEPLSVEDKAEIERAAEDPDTARAAITIQNVLDRRTLLRVDVSPESRVSVIRG